MCKVSCKLINQISSPSRVLGKGPKQKKKKKKPDTHSSLSTELSVAVIIPKNSSQIKLRVKHKNDGLYKTQIHKGTHPDKHGYTHRAHTHANKRPFPLRCSSGGISQPTH